MTWDIIWRIGLGYLKKTPQELGLFTMRQFLAAYQGYNQEKKEAFDKHMIGVRINSFWAFKGHAGKKLKRYDQLFPLEMDLHARRERLKYMKPVEIMIGDNGK